MQMRYFLTSILLSFSFFINSQIVTISPTNGGQDEAITLIFDASLGNGELVGVSKVYIHHGTVIDKPNGTAWTNVIGNWGNDDGVGEMTKVAGEDNKWQIVMEPSVKEYFGVSSAINIFRISCVFRSADGSIKGTIPAGEYGWGTVTSNLDMYVNLNSGNFLSITNPSKSSEYYSSGQPLSISAISSADVTNMKLWLDEGTGFEIKKEVTAGRAISYTYPTSIDVLLGIKVTATVDGEELELIKKHNVIIKTPNTIQDLPAGVISGINYDDSDPTKATLVLQAPNKEFVYTVGDFNDWSPSNLYQMKATPDGEYFWITINNLAPKQEYAFQYWIDGKLKIADPYSDKIADPYSDKNISPNTYPNLLNYNKTEFGIASVLQTGQDAYVWASSEATWIKPDVNHLTIYELHVRDFVASHSYLDLIDTIQYLKRLGVNAIELMPINEFENNDSWGYNPSFFLAPDKYYGTKDQLKKFIEVAHQNGIAVIQDIVLNHAFGQNPMVQMYFDASTGKPAAENPWFNREYVGQYQWGYDFNHESTYTQEFIDRVNSFWLEEYHFDGFRFDFTKGFTNYAPGGSVDGFDQSRINILKRMADQIWSVDNQAYIILEHWSPQSEESILGDYGMKMWRNKSYDFVPATVGNPVGSFGGTDATTHVSFYNSHDERRIAEHVLTEGISKGSYDASNPEIMFERVKLSAAFMFLAPGPKMIWQFDELGYDIDINFNGRTGKKPLPWGANSLGYYDQELRQNIYKAYKGILNVRNTITPQALDSATKNHQLTGPTRRYVYNTPKTDLVLIGNFGLDDNQINPSFTESGMWYDYFFGDSINVSNTGNPINLSPGEWHIYTNKRLNEGQPGVVSIYENPVTINPSPFLASDEITITYDATKGSFLGLSNNGLVDADKVYIHTGIIKEGATSQDWTNTIGNLTDDGVGLMTEVSDNIWEIKITPNGYYGTTTEEIIVKMGMYFRDADNSTQGFGFRESIIYFDVASNEPIITIEPANFDGDTEITITFNARQGNAELANADKVYMHSSMGIVETSAPQNNAWNNAIGNWGEDDGVGRMTKVPGTTDKWRIKLVPKDYYSLSNGDFPYWFAGVFRSANGSVKGTHKSGAILNGFVHTNQDYFIQNLKSVGVDDDLIESIKVFPNPTSGSFSITGITQKSNFQLISYDGQLVMTRNLDKDSNIDISSLPIGAYSYKVIGNNTYQIGKIILVK